MLLLAPAPAQDEALRAALSGDLPRAESLLEPADTPEKVMALGLVRQLQLRFSEAAELYQEGARKYPAEAAFRLGMLEKTPVQAAIRFRHALQADPSLSLARYNLAVATQSSPGPYEGSAGWCLVRFPGQPRLRFLELRSENLIQARWMAQGQTTEEALQAACEFTREPDPELWLQRARVAPGPRREVLVWRYQLAVLEPTGRDCDLAVWGPALLDGKTHLTFGVLRDGRVVDAADDHPLGLRVPEGGHALSIDTRGTARVWTRAGQIVLGQLGVRLAPGYRWSRPPVWDLLPAGPLRDYCVDSPFLTVDQRRQRTESLLAEHRLFALQELGNLALQRGDLAGAERHWRQALETDPGWELTAYNLAMVELLQHRPEDARKELDALQARIPASRVAFQERLRLAVLLQNPYEALKICQDYGARFPHDPYPVYAAAEILADGERLEPALEVLQGLVRSHPDLAEPRYLLATLLGRSGQARAQMDQLQWLLDHDPWPYRAQRQMAELMERLGQHDRAVELARAYLGSFWPVLFEPATYYELSERYAR